MEEDDMLKLSDNNENVKKLHLMLQKLHYPVKNITKEFNENTQGAVRSFQNDSELRVTGIVDDNTWNELEKRTVENRREAMATIKVFNNDENKMETYYRREDEAMPYNTGNTLKVREFRGSSKSDILWTEKRAMQAWNSFRFIYGRPIQVGFAFKRPTEGGHGQQSHDCEYTVVPLLRLDPHCLSLSNKL